MVENAVAEQRIRQDEPAPVLADFAAETGRKKRRKDRLKKEQTVKTANSQRYPGRQAPIMLAPPACISWRKGKIFCKRYSARRNIIFSLEKSHRKPEFFVNLNRRKIPAKPGKCRRRPSVPGGVLSNSAAEFRCEAVFTPSIIQIAAKVIVRIKEEQVYGRIEYCDCR